jgi:tRNA-specific 2-thiouridylase
VANYTDRFRSEVMLPFADDYLAGRTPIPCIACNRRFKFHHLLERAQALGATRVATGHYARVETDPDTRERRLRTALDLRKDQSYFLFDLDQAQLTRTLLPLGEMQKDEVRQRARALGLATADKPESQEICFVPDGDYARVVETLRPQALPGPGDIVGESGEVLGRHAGIHHFTVGQRRGLGVAAGERMYVTRIDAARNRVIVGELDALLAAEATVTRASWVAGRPPRAEVEARVRIRHRHEGADAVVAADAAGGARVRFHEPVRAIAPGQAAVFYQGDRVLGGGWIAQANP